MCDLTVFGSFYEKFRVDSLLQDNKCTTADVGGAIFPLQNEVFLLLAEQQFLGLRWDVLRPVMQVASKLLLSPGSEEYLHAAFMSKSRDVPYADPDRPDGEYNDDGLSNKTYKSLFRKGGALTATESQAIELRLLQMATWVTFGMGDTESCGLEGYCKPQDAKVKGISGWRGVASHIVLDENAYKLYCELHDTTSPDSPQEQKDRLHRLAFRIAVSTCHELAHAFRFARFSSNKIVGIGFETQCISEEGFDWETCVFGGSMQSSDARGAELTEWPSARTFDGYFRAGGLHMMFVARLPEHDVSIQWKVPDAYIRSMFQPSMWKKKVRGRGIQVPKLLGYRAVPCAPRGACRCFTCRKTEMFVEAHIECGNGKLDVQNHDRKVVALMRSLNKQSATSDPLLLQTRKLAAEDTFEDLDDRFHQDPEDQDTSHLYADCVREPWGEYPFGGWKQRRHAASCQNPASFAIPQGVVSLLDGTLVPEDKAPVLLRRETKVMERDIRKAGDLLNDDHQWSQEEQEEGSSTTSRSESEEMRARRLRLMTIVRAMAESEDPVVRRMVSGIEEVQAFETEQL